MASEYRRKPQRRSAAGKQVSYREDNSSDDEEGRQKKLEEKFFGDGYSSGSDFETEIQKGKQKIESSSSDDNEGSAVESNVEEEETEETTRITKKYSRFKKFPQVQKKITPASKLAKLKRESLGKSNGTRNLAAPKADVAKRQMSQEAPITSVRNFGHFRSKALRDKVELNLSESSSDEDESKTDRPLPTSVEKKIKSSNKSSVADQKVEIKEEQDEAIASQLENLASVFDRDAEKMKLEAANHVMSSNLKLSDSSSEDERKASPPKKAKLSTLPPKSETKQNPVDVSRDDDDDDGLMASQLENLAKNISQEPDFAKPRSSKTPKKGKKDSTSNVDCRTSIKSLLAKGEGVEHLLGSDDDLLSPDEEAGNDELDGGIEISLEVPNHQKKKKKKFDVEAYLKRELARVQREIQVSIHQTHILCLVAHLRHLNLYMSNVSRSGHPSAGTTLAVALSIVPPIHAISPEKLNLVNLAAFVHWFRDNFPIAPGAASQLMVKAKTGSQQTIMFPHPLDKWIQEALENYVCQSQHHLVVIFLAVSRALGWKSRLVLNFETVGLKPQKDDKSTSQDVEKSSNSDSAGRHEDKDKKRKKKGEKEKNDTDRSEKNKKESGKSNVAQKERDTKTEKVEKRGEKEKNDTDRSEKKKKESRRSNVAKKEVDRRGEKEKNDKEKGNARQKDRESKSNKRKSSDIDDLKPQKKTKNESGETFKTPKTSDNNIQQRRSSEKQGRSNRQSSKSSDRKSTSVVSEKLSVSPKLSSKALKEATNRRSCTLGKQKQVYIESSASEESEEDEVLPVTKNSTKSKKGKSPLATASKSRLNSESDFDEDQIRKRSRKSSVEGPSVERKVTKAIAKVPAKTIQYWTEILIPNHGWVSVDVIHGRTNCTAEMENLCRKPIFYIVACNEDGTIKDLTKKYVSPSVYLTNTRKSRVSQEWLDAIFDALKPRQTADEKSENEKIERNLQSAPMPSTVSGFKDHPLYVLKRHLLKFEAIYPDNAPPLGYIRSEAVYARECVHTLHCRVTWLKQGRVVRVGEEPYKIVKARPKWDRMNGTVIKDQPLEVFGKWQTEIYIPPPAVDGKVPRNEYGNVELFQPWMLPKGTTHIPIAGIHRLAKKLDIDCAQAMVGWEFSGGGCHPVFDGVVVCEEFAETLMDAWNKDQEEKQRKEAEKKEKRALDNWKKLIKGMLMHQKIRNKYLK